MFDDQIIHDLKNPLSGITGSIGLFVEGLLGDLTAEQKKYLTNIDISAKKLALLLEELRFVDNAEKGALAADRSAFPAEDLVKEARWIVSLAQKEEKKVVFNLPKDLSLTADRQLLTLIVEDLLLNAVKQSPRNGAATLEIKASGNEYLISIADSGAGLPAEYLPRVFDKDFRAENPKIKSGTSPGMGFYFCKLAVEAQGGKLRIESGPGQGTRFIISLPILT